MKIETNRLLLRSFTEEDRNDVFEYCSQEDVGEKAGWPAHKSADDTAQALEDWINNKNQLAIVWRENGKVIGHVAIHEDSEEGRGDTRELGCALNHDYQCRGIMSEAVRAVIDFLFGHGIVFIWACCFQENIASRKMIEKCGFQFQQKGTFYSRKLDRTFRSYEYCLSKNEWCGE